MKSDNMKKIMILGASILQLPAIKTANCMGFKTIVIDQNENAVGRREAGKFYAISTLNTNNILKIASKENIDGILTIASDRPMLTVAKVSEELKLNSISMETALNTSKKSNMRNILYNNNVPVPKYVTMTDVKSSVEFISNKKQEVILKPSANSGSRGVSLIKENANLEEINYSVNYAFKYSDTSEILIEEFMRGPEVSVETFSINGKCHIIAITDKITTGAPHFVEIGHQQPSSHPEEIKQKIKEITIKSVKALGIENGPSHTEIIITNDGPKIVEVGARLGGDQIGSKLTYLSTGINLVKLAIESSVGKEPIINRKWERFSKIQYFKQNEGVLTEIDNLEIVKRIPNVEDIYISKNIGDKVNAIKDSNDRLGYVLFSAYTEEELNRVSEYIKNTLKIKIMKKTNN